jgi:hypothetical protein
MNWTAAILLLLSFALLVAGAWLLSPPAGLLTAGVLLGAVGVLSLSAGSAKNRKADQ